MKIIDILHDMGSNPSRNYKQQVLEDNKGNDVLKEVFRLAYDPFTQFYIRKIPQYTLNLSDHAASLESMLPALSDLSKRVVTGNAAIERLKTILEAVDSDDALVIVRIIGKDLRVGCTGSTANKVWPNLVMEYPCMLASVLDMGILNKITYPAMAQLKMDGMRFNAIVRGNSCEFRSRNGKEINLLGNLEQEFIQLAKGKDLVFDGELVVSLKGKILDRQTGNGILNKAVKGTIGSVDAAMVCATIWDLIDYADFIKGKSTDTYKTRFDKLKAMAMPNKVELVEYQMVENAADAYATFTFYHDQGQEGIILKDLSGIWEDKRAKHQIKFKGELECDLLIVGVMPGTGKYSGMIGALQCESGDHIIKVDVGSGFSDEQRKQNPFELVGKIATIKYNARITNRQGGESLFLPILLEIREDKTEADTADKIK